VTERAQDAKAANYALRDRGNAGASGSQLEAGQQGARSALGRQAALRVADRLAAGRDFPGSPLRGPIALADNKNEDSLASRRVFQEVLAMREGCSSACLASFLIGASLGVAAALLLAPESGERTRRRIRRAAEDAQDYIEEVGGRIGEKADHALRSIEKKTRSVMG
jgi:hypothetical protein